MLARSIQYICFYNAYCYKQFYEEQLLNYYYFLHYAHIDYGKMMYCVSLQYPHAKYLDTILIVNCWQANTL